MAGGVGAGSKISCINAEGSADCAPFAAFWAVQLPLTHFLEFDYPLRPVTVGRFARPRSVQEYSCSGRAQSMTRVHAVLATALAFQLGLAQAQTPMPVDVVTDSNGTLTGVDIGTPIGPFSDEPPATSHNSPEPATLTLLGLGGLGAWWQMRRRKKAA